MGISYNGGNIYPTVHGQMVKLKNLSKISGVTGYGFSQNYDYTRIGGTEKWLAGDVVPGRYQVTLNENNVVKKTLYIVVNSGETTYADFDKGTSTQDNYEFNNTISDVSSSTAISTNQVITSYISNSKDVDYFKIRVSTAKKLTATLSNLPADYDIRLYSASGSVLSYSLSSGTVSEQLSYNLSANTNYYISVTGYNNKYDFATPYRLQLSFS